MSRTNNNSYYGFEQGPIRPPSEAFSLFIRITRNCPWNRCTFCPVYKHQPFSIRPVEHVIRDIDAVYTCITALENAMSLDSSQVLGQLHINKAAEQIDGQEYQALPTAANWMTAGKRSVFLQDANSLVIKPAHLIEILNHLKKRFPSIQRITSYARSQTIARIDDEKLKEIAQAGLNRVHIGLESGSDIVLKKVQKGVTKEMHIKAGLKVKQAGIQCSEYVMPGLGGRELSEIHALETADALNQINPEFIRLRTLALPGGIELTDDLNNDCFKKNSELETVKEILTLIENLNEVTSQIKSDHVLNLFQEVEGKMPQDKDKMTEILKTFLELSPQEQCLVQVGMRLGVFHFLDDRFNPGKREKVEELCRQFNVTPVNVDDIVTELMKRFV